MITESVEETIKAGETIGKKLRGGETIELVSDLGGGKTQFVRGLAKGIGSRDQVQSPSFTISRIYKGKDIELWHFDFHRLDDPGLMKHELAEALTHPEAVVAVEWGDSVADILPADRLVVTIKTTGENTREINLEATGPQHERLIGEVL